MYFKIYWLIEMIIALPLSYVASVLWFESEFCFKTQETVGDPRFLSGWRGAISICEASFQAFGRSSRNLAFSRPWSRWTLIVNALKQFVMIKSAQILANAVVIFNERVSDSAITWRNMHADIGGRSTKSFA